MTKVSFAKQVASIVGANNASSPVAENAPVVAPETKKTATVSRGFFAIILSFFSCFCFGTKKKPIPEGKATLVQQSRTEVRQTATKTEVVSKVILQQDPPKYIPTVFKVTSSGTGQTTTYNLNDNSLEMRLSLFRTLPDDSLASAKFKSASLGGDQLTKITEKDIDKFRSLVGKKTLSFSGSPNLTELPIKALLSLPKDLTIDLRNIGFDDEQAIKDIEKAKYQQGYKGPTFIFSSEDERAVRKMTPEQRDNYYREKAARQAEVANYSSSSSCSQTYNSWDSSPGYKEDHSQVVTGKYAGEKAREEDGFGYSW